MLPNLKELYGSKLAALDGDIGEVKDFYFDGRTGVIRYVVADTGTWLAGRLVLLAPHAFGKWDQYEKTLHLKLPRKQIENGLSLEPHQPVSRQHEVESHRHYGWPAYWEGGAAGSSGGSPGKSERDDEPLQRTRAVTGYHVQTADGVIGRVGGFLVNDRSWAIQELVVEAGDWPGGREIPVAFGKVERISHEEATVFLNLTKAEIPRTAENDLAQTGAGHSGAGNFRD